METANQFPYEYSCTFSPLLRSAVSMVGKEGKQGLQKLVEEEVVRPIQEDKSIARSLKYSIVPGARVMRQVDLRREDESLLFKTFICWDHKMNTWLVFMEGADENYWEQDKLSKEAS